MEGKVIGMAIALVGGILMAIFNFIRHRRVESLLERAGGEGKAPCRWLVQWDHAEATRWAKEILARTEDVAFIDITESGAGTRDVVIEVAAVDTAGTVLFHSLINSANHPLNPRTSEEHGLVREHIENSPGFDEV